MTTSGKQRLPAAVFLGVALTGWIGAAAIWIAGGEAGHLRFAAVADEATNRISERLRLHLMLIDATAAMFETQPSMLTAEGFATYYHHLELDLRNPGIAGLGFGALTDARGAAALDAELRSTYGAEIGIWPRSSAPFVVPVTILGSSDSSPPPAIGFDMYSEPTRRAAMEAATAAGEARATEPVKLATDTDPVPGFIVYAPVYATRLEAAPYDPEGNRPSGFAFGGFRIGDLVTAALHVPPLLPIALSVYDLDQPDTPLYQYGSPLPGAPPQLRSLDVAGQTWTLAFRPAGPIQTAGSRVLSLAVGAITTALAAAAAFAVVEQGRARRAAEALAEANVRNLAEKDMLLQEMKHRIKNAIARILAIARQTASQSEDMPAFTASFTQRLQAMAAAQDMLTRSADATADLRELLMQELAQVFGPQTDAGRVQGPDVELSSVQTQALGLVFHELATNALKHGSSDGRAPEIQVIWRIDGKPGERRLAVDWTEATGPVAEPTTTGFGARLIQANLRDELGGEITRDWTETGLRLRFWIPLPQL